MIDSLTLNQHRGRKDTSVDQVELFVFKKYVFRFWQNSQSNNKLVSKCS